MKDSGSGFGGSGADGGRRRNSGRGRQIVDLDGAGVEHGKTPARGRKREVSPGVEDRRGGDRELNLAGGQIVDLDALAADFVVVQRVVGADGVADFKRGAGHAQAVSGAGQQRPYFGGRERGFPKAGVVFVPVAAEDNKMARSRWGAARGQDNSGSDGV